jgi:hypothetical protein
MSCQEFGQLSNKENAPLIFQLKIEIICVVSRGCVEGMVSEDEGPEGDRIRLDPFWEEGEVNKGGDNECSKCIVSGAGG